MALEAIIVIPILPRLKRLKTEGKNVQELAERVEVLESFIEDLVRILQDRERAIINLANLQLQLINVGVWYFQLPDPATGVHADDSWRMILVDDGIEFQKKLSGVWTKASRIEY